jgi:hypothetical protein
MAVALMLGGCRSEKLGQSPKGPDASVGTTTFSVVLPQNESFCDQIGPCSGAPAHLQITDSTGQYLYDQTASFFCYCDESNCLQSCLTIACIGPGDGVAITGGDQAWPGVYYAPSDRCGSTCGTVPHYLPPGQYIAQFCATPGTLENSDGGPPACTKTGNLVCGPNVPFTYPSDTPIVLMLPTPDGSVSMATP